MQIHFFVPCELHVFTTHFTLPGLYTERYIRDHMCLFRYGLVLSFWRACFAFGPHLSCNCGEVAIEESSVVICNNFPHYR